MPSHERCDIRQVLQKFPSALDVEISYRLLVDGMQDLSAARRSTDSAAPGSWGPESELLIRFAC